SEKIEIAFNPLTEKFEVADAAIRKDKSYISNISQLWSKDTDIFHIVDSYIEGLKSVRELTSDEVKIVKKSITKLNGLLSYPFTALELAANINEEQVSEVFVRINSEGKKLEQADFILTLMSVFWDAGRTELETFCREARMPSTGKPTPFNHFIQPSPDQLLRVSVGVAFKRARLQNVYSILRGKDLETEEFSPEKREEQFAILKKAQERVLNLQYWHDFFKAIKQAGYRSGDWISSENNLLFSYTLYLIGRTEYAIDEFKLREALAKWFFMSSLTARFSSSPESKMEYDLARFRQVKNGDEFIKVLEKICDDVLANDFWTITLPNQLATSSPKSPALFAYNAALNLLDAKVLFSKHKISELADPSVHANRSDFERHHLFPKEYLKSIGVSEVRDTNQIANYAFVEWGDNSAIGKNAPKIYLPSYRQRHSGQDLQKMYHWHALPDNWEELDYQDFLGKRRDLISKIIKEAYSLLNKSPAPAAGGKEVSVAAIIAEGESYNLEFKSSLRVNLHTNQKDPRMEMSCIKTIAGFLNGKGGTLLIGVKDDGETIGIDADGFQNEDKMLLHLTNLIKDKISPQHMMYIHPHFIELDGKRVLSVECNSSKSPVYVKDDNTEKFFIRTGASTSELSASQTQEFIRQKFA
ncbi:MAG: putative DNA binding domain-containing protein, partial [Methyloversatilis discipulorum]|uniref:RNA-binding domain-containing protein n=1 Tax=Methyloversatilis discipulorum TaxID=1119528 RepID=UPI0026EE7ACA